MKMSASENAPQLLLCNACRRLRPPHELGELKGEVYRAGVGLRVTVHWCLEHQTCLDQVREQLERRLGARVLG